MIMHSTWLSFQRCTDTKKNFWVNSLHFQYTPVYRIIIPILPLLNVEQCVVICSNNVIHITFAAWKEIFASSFIPSEFKPVFHCIPVLQTVTEIGRVFIMLLYPPLNEAEGGYTGFTLSVRLSVSTLFSMLFSALWLGCGELGMRKYSPRYLRVMAEMRI